MHLKWASIGVSLVLAWSCFACGSSSPPPEPAAPLSPPTNLCSDRERTSCRDPLRVERWLRTAPFEILGVAAAPGGVSGTKVLTLRLHPRVGQPVTLRAKWRKHDTVMFNDSRKELCAYAVQKLFLEPTDFVAPPTTTRCFEMSLYRRWFEPKAEPTFPETRCVYGVLSYWLEDIEGEDEFDQARFEEDVAYREAVANFNLFTYLILHGDSHKANFYVPADERDMRIYSVDNAVAFSPLIRHPLDFFLPDWSEMRVPAVTRASVARLRNVDDQQLWRLSVVEQLRLVDGVLVPVEPTQPQEVHKGVRFVGSELQIGLTKSEIEGLKGRIEDVLELVKSGELNTFRAVGDP